MKEHFLIFQLKLCKKPSKAFLLLYKLRPLLIGKVFPPVIPNKTIAEIEQMLLLSSIAIDFSSNKDMHSHFIQDFVELFTNFYTKLIDVEEIIYLFESSGSGISFQNSQGKDRIDGAYEELYEYIFERLMLYNDLSTQFYEGDISNLEAFITGVFHCYFWPGRFHLLRELSFLNTYLSNSGAEPEISTSEISFILYSLQKIRNIVSFDTSRNGSNHTEGKLAYVKLNPKAKFLAFNSISGQGCLHCNNCGHEEDLVCFIHGAFEAQIGRQCPQCGCFCTEYNVSEEYHILGKAKEDFICPECGYTIRRIEESIFKGNENPIFCPHCESLNLDYTCSMLT